MKDKILYVILSILMLVFIKQAYCGELTQARSLFYQGNIRYSEGDFQQAIIDYERVLSLGFESGALYYNLGNSYFKEGLLGKAIANYLRAERLIPQDADLRSNLDYARSLVKDRCSVSKRKWFMQLFYNLSGLFNLDTISLISSILYFILSIIIILIITLKNLRRVLCYISLPISILLVISIISFCTQFYSTVIQRWAIVVVKTSDSRFEPFDNATSFFTLSEGERVAIVISKGDWIKVKREDGKQGWVRKNDIEFL